MIRIVFKNMVKSELVRAAIQERLASVTDRFPDLGPDQITLTVDMRNSPSQAGPDVFTVKFYCRSGRYRGVTLEKSAPNLYAALAELVDHLQERLNRFGDKSRVKRIKEERKAVL